MGRPTGRGLFMRRYRWIIRGAVLALLLALGAVPAMAEEELPAEDVELTFVCGTGDVKFDEVMETLIAKFQEEYPMITINNVTPLASSFSEGMKSLDAVGEFPDLMEARDVPMWARAGKIAEVDPELIALVDNAPSYNGKYYCVPVKADAPEGFYYNKAYFDEKAGINLYELFKDDIIRTTMMDPNSGKMIHQVRKYHDQD